MPLKKKNYGQVPTYLKKRKEELRETHQMYESYLASNMQNTSAKTRLEENEKWQLLQVRK